MVNKKDIPNIPQEKFRFVESGRLAHEAKLDTKPHSYMYDAFLRFCKNKGSVVAAIIIIIMVLFAIITPFCTPYKVSYNDVNFQFALPKLHLFENTDFWDGCTVRTAGFQDFIVDYATSTELDNAKEGNGGHRVIKNLKYKTIEGEDGQTLYVYRWDTYHQLGTIYKQISTDEYEMIQEYQNDTGNQVLYPTVRPRNRPQASQDNNDAKYYFETKMVNNKTEIVLDENGNVIPVYWQDTAANLEDGYHSLRIEGQEGFEVNGETYFYAYSRYVSGGDVEVRINYYEYYIFYHTRVLKDGITEPYFIFGTTDSGRDILTCLSAGARFSFIFAIAIAS